MEANKWRKQVWEQTGVKQQKGFWLGEGLQEGRARGRPALPTLLCGPGGDSGQAGEQELCVFGGRGVAGGADVRREGLKACLQLL